MCGYQNALSNIMPIDWLDPYGRTPFAKDAELSVDITIVETDDGIRAKSVKNPPTSGSDRLMNAIKNALGVGMMDSVDPCSSPQAADLGKQDNVKNKDNKGSRPDHHENDEEKPEGRQKPDTMESIKPGGFKNRDRNPGSPGSPGPSRYGATEEEGEEKAPRRKS